MLKQVGDRPFMRSIDDAGHAWFLDQRESLVIMPLLHCWNKMLDTTRGAQHFRCRERSVLSGLPPPAYLRQKAGLLPGTLRTPARRRGPQDSDRKSTRLNSSHVSISYAVFC